MTTTASPYTLPQEHYFGPRHWWGAHSLKVGDVDMSGFRVVLQWDNAFGVFNPKHNPEWNIVLGVFQFKHPNGGYVKQAWTEFSHPSKKYWLVVAPGHEPNHEWPYAELEAALEFVRSAA